MQSPGGAEGRVIADDPSDLLARLVDLPAPGWYPDPEDQAFQRLWSGARWAAVRRRIDSEEAFGFDYLDGGPATTSLFDLIRPGSSRPFRGTQSMLAARPASERSGPTPRVGRAYVAHTGPWAVGAAAVFVIAAMSVEHLTAAPSPGPRLAQGAATASTASGARAADGPAPPTTSMPRTKAPNSLPPTAPTSPADTPPGPGRGIPAIEPAPLPVGVSSSSPPTAESAAPTIPTTQPPQATTSPGVTAAGRGRPPEPSPTVLAHAHGSGIAETATFATRGLWSVYWSYGCSAGHPGSFDFTGYTPDGRPSDIFGPGQVGAGGSGIEHYSDAGSFDLVVNSGCTWDIQVVG